MKNPIKSVLSCALSLALCVCFLPASAFAVEAPAEPVATGEQEQMANADDERNSIPSEVDGLEITADEPSIILNANDAKTPTGTIEGDNGDTGHWSLVENEDLVYVEDENGEPEKKEASGLTLAVRGTFADWDTEGEVIENGVTTGTCALSAPWVRERPEYKERITKVAFNEPTKFLTLREVFQGYVNLKAFEGLSNLDVSEVKNMQYAFGGCDKLESLDLSKWNTDNVETAKGMFAQCGALKTITTSTNGALITNATTDASYMFENCRELTTIDTSQWDTGNVTDMTNMFTGCKSLKNIDVSSWNTSNVRSMRYLFYGCSSLAELAFGVKWKTDHVTDMTSMFGYCTRLATISGLEGWNTSGVSRMNMSEQVKEKDENGIEVDKVVVGPDGTKIPVHSTNGLFAGCTSLEDLSGISNWDVSGIDDMSYMFANCESLTNLNISNWNTSNVRSMRYLFYGCSSLAELAFGVKWKTDHVTDMTSMFGYCTSLKTIHGLDSWATNNVEKVYELAPAWNEDTGDIISGRFSDNGLFTGCRSLQSIDGLPNWQVNNVEDLSYMFAWCVSLGDISPVSDWTVGTDKLKNMFLDCPITKMQFGEGWIGELNAGNLGINPSSDVWEYDNGTETKQLTTDQLFEGLNEGLYMDVALVNKLDIKNAAVKYDSDQLWTGKPVATEIAVTYDGVLLKEGTDYQVVYANNVNVGEASATVKGIGKYAGEQSFTFRIYKFDFSGASVTAPSDQLWTGSAITPPLVVTYNGATLRQGTDYEVRYENNINVGIARGTVTGLGQYGGEQSFTFQIITNPDLCQVMYRAYNPNSGEHFYTAHYDEVESVVAAGWRYEGEAWTAPVSSATPVYRLYSGTDHHYTTSVVERDHLVSVGWSDEGIGWYSDDAQGVGLHRLFNPNVDPNAPANNSGSHHYTTSVVERDHLVSVGWLYEDFGWYGVK